MNKCLLLSFYFMGTFTTLATELPVSYLKLFPEKELQPIILGYPYCSMTSTEKDNAIFLGEGCYTILESKDDCALVGPLRPCQLIVLNLKNGPSVVAHASSEANLQELLYTIMNTYPACNFQETCGELFTVHHPKYDEQFRFLYENRSQLEELKHKKDLIIKTFNILERTQIRARKFTPQKEHYNTIKYACAQFYVWLKRYCEKANIYNICPITENCWAETSNLPAQQVQIKLNEIRKVQNNSNPFWKNEIRTTYGNMPFAYVQKNR